MRQRIALYRKDGPDQGKVEAPPHFVFVFAGTQVGQLRKALEEIETTYDAARVKAEAGENAGTEGARVWTA